MAVRWLTPFRWLHDRLHALDAAEDRKYREDRGTVYSKPLTAGEDWHMAGHTPGDTFSFEWSDDGV